MDRPAAVVLDVGETILERGREYAAWARYFGLTPHTFSAVFGAGVAQRRSVAEIITGLGDGRNFAALLADRGADVELVEEDLYPDARPFIADVRAAGLVVGIAGNQPVAVAEQLRALELGADFVASSAEWGTAKPAAGFFARAVTECGVPATQVVYVGDQTRNDVTAPVAAGLQAVRLRRGPWGHLDLDEQAEAAARAVVGSLAELAVLLVEGALRGR